MFSKSLTLPVAPNKIMSYWRPCSLIGDILTTNNYPDIPNLVTLVEEQVSVLSNMMQLLCPRITSVDAVLRK